MQAPMFYKILLDNKDQRFMKALRTSPEFANRAKLLAEYDRKKELAAGVP